MPVTSPRDPDRSVPHEARSPSRALRHQAGRWRRRVVRGTAVAVAAGGLAVAGTGAAHAGHGDPDDRRTIGYTVRSGDTATGIAVRFHAWTAELVAHNGLGPSARVHVGQRLRVPVVVSAAREHGHRPGAPAHGRHAHRSVDRDRHHRGGRPGRARVRRVVAATARRHGVDPQLALAVSWQEAGWQMQHVSGAGAIGAMQVIPSTGTWMEWYAGRELRLRDLRDNATAGVLLLRVLDSSTRSQRRQLAAYYQGLGAVREHGLYDDTEAYVANVRAIKRRLESGRPPA